MTATAGYVNGWCPEGAMTQLPPGATIPAQASSQAGLGQFIFYDANGRAALNDGTVPALVSAGVAYPAKISASAPTAGAASMMSWWGFGGHAPASTVASDTPTAASFCTPVWCKDENTVGLLSNYAGSNRSLVGLCFGLLDDGSPRVWAGPVAASVARGVLIANAFPLAHVAIADAAANTATTEKAINRPRIKGYVTSVSYTGSALVVGDTDYVTVSVAKRDGAGGGAVVIATYDSRAAGNGAATAFVPKEFTLSVVAHALELLETDVVTVTVVKGASGQVLTGTILINGKAL